MALANNLDTSLRINVDAKTGQITAVATELGKVKVAAGGVNDVVVRGRDKFITFSNAVESTGFSALRTTGAFSAMDKTLGGMPGLLINVANGLDNVNDKSNALSSSVGSATKSIGGLGTAALIAGTAFTGWQIGTWINNTFQLGKAFESLENSIEKGVKQGGAFATMIAVVTGQYQRMKEEAGMDLLVPVADAALNARRRANAKTQAATDQFTTDLLVKNKLKETAATEAANAKMTAAAEAHYKEMIRLIQQEGEAYAKVQEDETAKQMEELHKRIDQMTAFDQGFLQMAQKNGAGISEIGQAFTDDLTARVNDFSNNFMEIARKNGEAGKDMGEKIAKGMLAAAGGMFKLADQAYKVAQIFNELANIIGGRLGEQLADLGQIAEGVSQGFTGIGQIMSGDILGGIQNLIGAIGKLFKALKDLFGHNWGKDVGHQLGMEGLTGISSDLQKRIADLAKQIGDSKTAIVLSLGEIADEIGITEQNAQSFFSNTRDVFVLLQGGFIDTAQASTVLEDMFPRLAAAAEQFGGTYRAQLLEMIQLSEQFGLHIKAIDDYIQTQIRGMVSGIKILADQLSALMSKIPEGTTPGGPGPSANRLDQVKAKFNELAQFVVTAFNQMMAAGMSFDQIMAQLGPTMDILEAAAERFGLKGSEAFQHLMEIMKTLEDNKALQRLQGLTDIMTSFVNLGIKPTNKEWGNFQGQINKTYKDLVAGGLTGREALQQMIPSLQEAIRMHELFGIPINKNTQALIDQARAAGLLGETTDPMTAGFDRVVTAINNLTLAMGGTIDTIGQMGSAAWQTAGQMNAAFRSVSGPSLGGVGDSGIILMDSLRTPALITRDRTGPIMLDRGEMVLDRDSSREFRQGNRRGGGGHGSVHHWYITQQPWESGESFADRVAQAVINEERKGALKRWD